MASSNGILPPLSPTGHLQALYVGWFGRAADAAGFQYWDANALTQILGGASVGTAMLNISKSFALSTENSPYASLASLTTPFNPTPAQSALAASFINQTYTNLFSHQADDAGLAYWQSAYFSGQVPFSALVYAIAQAATGNDFIVENNKVLAGSYFTSANAGVAGAKAAVVNVIDKTTELASQAATDVIAGSSHNQITYSSILSPGAFTTGVRAELNGQVILTGSQPSGAGGGATQATLYVGPFNDTTAGTKYLLTPTIDGQTVTTSTFYGPNTSIFNPSYGAGNVQAVGSYQYSQSPSGTFNHGMLYRGPASGVGGTWQQTDVPANGVNVVGGVVVGQVADTISHSTMGDLVVGNYDLTGTSAPIKPGSANAYVYNTATAQWTLTNFNGSMTSQTTLYGVWQNGVSSTSYTLAGGTNNGFGINQGLLVNYDSLTGVFSNLTLYSANNVPGVVTHFENITAVPGGFNLVATTDSGPAFAAVTVNADGSFGNAAWTTANLPGSSLMTGNIAYQGTIGGIYNTTASASPPSTYTGIVDQSRANSAGGLIMPVGSYDFVYATTVTASTGAPVTGSTTAGNVLGGSIGNEIITGTSSLVQPDTIYTGGGADTIVLAPGRFASTRIELYAGNSINNSVVPGGVERAVAGSIVNASDIPQLGWWGQATAQVGGPVSNASTNAGNGNGTSLDMSTVVNFVTGSSSSPVDKVDFSLSAFSNLLRTDGGASTPALGSAVFSNLLSPGGTVTVANADVLLLGNTFANAAAVAASLANSATAITFAGAQLNALNHYLVAYQDLSGSVRIADLDIHRGATPFLTTAQGQNISASDMVQLVGVSLSSLNAANLQFVA